MSAGESRNVDLRLPDEKRAGATWRPSRPSRLPMIVSIATLVVLLVFVAQESLDLLGKRKTAQESRDPTLDRTVAERLADAGQYAEAARLFGSHANWGRLSAEERARLFYRAADYHMRAGEYNRALVALFRSEAAATLDELQPDITARKKQCFERLGNVAGWEQELARLTDVGDRPPTQGETVVAELDGRRITMLELDQLIEARLPLMLGQASQFLPPDELARRKQQILKQFSTSEAKLRFLNTHMEEQLLVREAIARGFHSDPDVVQTLDHIRTSLLAQRVRDAEAQAAEPTESDVREFYDAHRDQFTAPEEIELRMIMLDSEDAAKATIDELNAGADFAELAKQRSLDQATRDSGGELLRPATRLRGIPGVGRQPELIGHVFALEAGQTSSAPFKLDDKYYVFRVRTRTAERVRPFEEVEAEARRHKTAQRRGDRLNELLAELMTKYNATIHTGAFQPDAEAEVPRGKTPPNEPTE